MRRLAFSLMLLAGLAVNATNAAATIKRKPAAQTPVTVEAAFQAWFTRHTAVRQPGALAPRDECTRLPGAKSFREALARAVWRGDADTVAALAARDVRLGFGGESGQAQFRQQLRAKGGAAMAELKELIPLGCAVERDGTIVMPWLFAQNPGSIDVFEAMVVTGHHVPLRKAASPRGVIKARLDWQIVSLIGGLLPGNAYQRVRSANGTEGYVATRMLRSLIDTRIIAEGIAGQWRITAVASGD